MNAVEIEEAVSELAVQPFDRDEFPYAFLAAFGNKETTIKRLRSGQSNASDVAGGVLQRNNIHIAACGEGAIGAVLASLRHSPKTVTSKAKFILATDGVTLEAEDLVSGETIASSYHEFAEHFGFFLPLAGISTVKEIKNNPIDVKATGRLNKLYVELLKDNADWATEEKRPALNQFMARLIFCFFAEDTGIFRDDQFTRTIDQMSDSQAGNTHEVLAELFRAMDTKPEHRKAANLRSWADAFPYVNGGLFTGMTDCPRFSRIARSYLLRAGELDWQLINPDIFGSMIQAVADDDERGELGLHYTSVPNILKVLNPLFLDDLREQLEAAGDNVRKLRNLRKRLSAIRVFDPACGSGNFLVIAYKEMRAIEHEITKLSGDNPRSQIPLSNFYGIEIKSFAAEIARLALLIAEFQADCIYISQHEARAMVLPLHQPGHIKVDNALRIDWLEACPPATKTFIEEHDLGGPTGRLALEDNGLEGAIEPETYICGNPPYKGSSEQTSAQKEDLSAVFSNLDVNWKSLDYVSGWLMKATQYSRHTRSSSAFVSTNSICQGQQVSLLWPTIFSFGRGISFAYSSFRWSNLAQFNAGVTVIIVGLAPQSGAPKRLFEQDSNGEFSVRLVPNINPYIVPYENVFVDKCSRPISQLPEMDYGSKPADGGHLIIKAEEIAKLGFDDPTRKYLLPYVGTAEFIDGTIRYCIWITKDEVAGALANESIAARVDQVRQFRLKSTKLPTKAAASRAHSFLEVRHTVESNETRPIVIPIHTSESREFLPVGFLPKRSVISNAAFGLYDAELWNIALIASRLHLVWIATVCGKLETRYRYSNTLGWNTFPVPLLTEQNKADLTRSAESILLTREAHFPATIADLYEPENMPPDLRRAHDANDEIIDRIYIGRRFRNDTERLEKLFDLYTKMMAAQLQPKKKAKKSA